MASLLVSGMHNSYTPPALRKLRASMTLEKSPMSETKGSVRPPIATTPVKTTQSTKVSPSPATSPAGAPSDVVAHEQRGARGGTNDITGRPRRRPSSADLAPTVTTAEAVDTSLGKGGRGLNVCTENRTTQGCTGMHVQRRPSTASLDKGMLPAEGASMDLAPTNNGVKAAARLSGGLKGSTFHIARDAPMRSSQVFHGASMALSAHRDGPSPPGFRRGSTERMHERPKPSHGAGTPRRDPSNTPRADAAAEWRAAIAQSAAVPAAGFSRGKASSPRMRRRSSS